MTRDLNVRRESAMESFLGGGGGGGEFQKKVTARTKSRNRKEFGNLGNSPKACATG